MNRVALAVVLSTSMALSATNAQAATVVYEATLSGAIEAPPNASSGTGSALVYYDNVAHTLLVQTNFANLLGNTTAAHIHIITDTTLTTGPVFTQTPSFSGFPLGVQSGTYAQTFDLTDASSWNPSQLNGLFAGNVALIESFFAVGLQDGRGYLNIHSNLFPGGEIRGFLSPAVPEPATWAMLLLGFGLAGAALRRRPSLARTTAFA